MNTLRCHRCHRPIKAPAMLERKIVANYGPRCARMIFGTPKRKPAASKVMRWAHARIVGDLEKQMEFDGMAALEEVTA